MLPRTILGRRSRSTPPDRLRQQEGRRSILRFIGVAVSLIAGYFGVTSIPSVEAILFTPCCSLFANVSGRVLGLFGQPAVVSECSITVGESSLLIARGCDILDPLAVFAAMIAGFPVTWSAKLLGLGSAVVVLSSANVIRILSLLYIKIHQPASFEFWHVEVWQSTFFVTVIVLWILWARRATKKHPSVSHVQATAA